jgi:hypothetical protein
MFELLIVIQHLNITAGAVKDYNEHGTLYEA